MRNSTVILIFFVIINGILFGLYPNKTFGAMIENVVTFNSDNTSVVGVGALGAPYSSNNQSANGILPNNINNAGATPGGTSVNQFFDSLGTVWNVVLFLFSFILMPITFFVVGGFNVWIQLWIGLPLCIIYVFSLIMMIRGVFD